MSPRSALWLTAAISLVAGLALAFVHPGVSSAQAGGLEITSVVADSWPAVQATATVVDAQGQPVTGLAPADFSASIAGEPVPVTGLNTASDPGLGIAVVLTFDTSGSMEGAPMEQAKAAGNTLLQQLGPEDQVAVVAFSDGVNVVQGFTADKAAAAQAINNLVPIGNTALYAAVSESVRVAGEAPLPRRAVVLLSDGADFGGVSNVDRNATVQRVADSGILLYAVGLGEIDQEYLAQVASAGRGQFRVAPTPGDLGALYQGAAGVLRQQYVVTVDAASVDPTQVGSGPVRLEVNVAGQTFAGEAPITLPPGLVEPPVTEAVTAAPVDQPVAEPGANPVAADDESSSFPVAPVAGAALLGVGGVAAILLLMRRRRAAYGAEFDVSRLERDTTPVEYPVIERAAGESPSAWLVAGDESFPLTGEPATVGFTGDCSIRLPNGVSGQTDRARVWLRDGRYMIHNLSRVGGVTIAGKPVTWAILEDGDEISLGDCTLTFHDREPSEE